MAATGRTPRVGSVETVVEGSLTCGEAVVTVAAAWKKWVLRKWRILQEGCRNDAVGRIRGNLDDAVVWRHTLRWILVEDVQGYLGTNFYRNLSRRLASRASGSRRLKEVVHGLFGRWRDESVDIESCC